MQIELSQENGGNNYCAGRKNVETQVICKKQLCHENVILDMIFIMTRI